MPEKSVKGSKLGILAWQERSIRWNTAFFFDSDKAEDLTLTKVNVKVSLAPSLKNC